MFTECMLFVALLNIGSISETPEDIMKASLCMRDIPSSMVQYIDYYVEFYDEENLTTALKIGWCESRGKQNAYRDSADDSGIMQFIPSTWDWVAKKYDVPLWDTKITVQRWYGIDRVKVQFDPYWNIKLSSHLAEDIYKRTTWKDWASSKWCWENDEKFMDLVKREKGL